MISYRHSDEGISSAQLSGFFVGWPNPPTPETHLQILRGSTHVVLAIDSNSGNVVGFVTEKSDGVLCAYVSLLEVLPDYHDRGIGQQLTRRLLDKIRDHYVIDIVCDQELGSFYQRFGMIPTRAMSVRNYEYQSGRRTGA